MLVSAIVFGSFTGYVAREKGYSQPRWLLLGAAFQAIALLAAVGLPDRNAAVGATASR
jgi:hypothetical protein